MIIVAKILLVLAAVNRGAIAKRLEKENERGTAALTYIVGIACGLVAAFL